MKMNIGDMEKKLLGMGFVVRVYYDRDAQKRPVATGAVISDDDGIPLAVGLATCHVKDNPCKRKGRHIAVCRAAKELGVV